MHAEQALEHLLLSMFSADELRRWVRYLPGGEHVTLRLPGANVSPALLVAETVAALARDGLLQEDFFWARLATERPRRQAEIDAVRRKFPLFSGPSASVPPIASPCPAQGSRLKVLLVSAVPDTMVRLRVDREFRDIIVRVRTSRHRDRIQFEQIQAASFTDLRIALLEHQPHVLHISAHGESDGSLVLEGAADAPQRVPKRNLLRLLRTLTDNLRLVVLNACESAAVACDIPPTIDLAIGMSDRIADNLAISFAVALYESLGYGKSVETAFNVALAGLDEIDDELPQLFPPAENDPERKRRQPLIPS